MVRVLLVTESWSKTVEVESADEVIDAEGMSWQRDDEPSEAGAADSGGSDSPLRYVPAVSA